MANPLNRCFFCKTNLYGSIGKHTDGQMVSGANLDDLGEYRPGLDAARDHAVRHPYLEAGIDKQAVRRLARTLGLGELSELPAAPCLSSRVETGIAIRADVLRAIHSVERELAQSFPRGTVRCRVRASGVVVELDPNTLAALDEARRGIVRQQAAALFAGIVPSSHLSLRALSGRQRLPDRSRLGWRSSSSISTDANASASARRSSAPARAGTRSRPSSTASQGGPRAIC